MDLFYIYISIEHTFLPTRLLILMHVKHTIPFLISNFSRVLNVALFLLGDSPESEFFVPMV